MSGCAHTSYAWLSAALFVRGMGLGAVMMPTIAGAYSKLSKDKVSRAAPTLSAIQQVGASLGSALLVTALTQQFTHQLTSHGIHTTAGGGAGQISSLPPQAIPVVGPLLAHSFGYAFWIAFALTAVIIIPALFLPRHAARDSRHPANSEASAPPFSGPSHHPQKGPSSMKLLILGSTGPTGRHVLDRALEHGDTITVLARRPEALESVASRITVIAGDATSASDVAEAMAGQDAVIAALGRGRSVRADDLFTRAATAVVDAAKQTGVTRLVWLSSFGVGDTFHSANAMQKTMYRTFLRNIYANKQASEKTIRASNLDWTLVYPTALTSGPATGAYRVDDRLDMKLAARISRADVAEPRHSRP
jgi:putative NADH-flavin reductase